MSWIAINSATWHKETVSASKVDIPTAEEKKYAQNGIHKVQGYEYKEELLKAAADVVAGRPRRRKAPNFPDTKTNKVAKPKTVTSRKLRQTHATHEEEEKENRAVRTPQQHTRKSEAKTNPLLDITNNYKSNASSSTKSRKHTPHSPLEKDKTTLTRPTVISNQSNGSILTRPAVHEDRFQFHGRANPDCTIVEISSDDDTSYSSHTARADSDYDQFDDSIFDEVFQTPLQEGTTKAQNSPLESATKKSSYANGAPFPPFLHPCLLESWNREALGFNKKYRDASSRKHTCFRAAEVLRLTKHLQEHLDLDQLPIKIEMFATIHEVKYADRSGRGQGIIFSDLFFPSKPPYITTVSRTPYVGRDLVSPVGKEHNPRPVVKAVLLFNPKGIILRVGSTSLKTSITKTPSDNLSQVDPTYLEVLDIQVTS